MTADSKCSIESGGTCLSFAKTLRSRFWSAEIGQFADRPKISDWLRVGGTASPDVALAGSQWSDEGGWRVRRLGGPAASFEGETRRAGTRPPNGRSDDGGHRLLKLHDPARVGEFNWPDVRRILVEREMRASSDSTRSSERGCGADVFRSGRGRGSDTCPSPKPHRPQLTTADALATGQGTLGECRQEGRPAGASGHH